MDFKNQTEAEKRMDRAHNPLHTLNLNHEEFKETTG